MQFRIPLILILIFLLSRNSVNSQKLCEFDFAIHGIVSKLDINSKSPLYNNAWVKPNFEFYRTTGFGLSLGFTRKLTEKCQAHLSGRWQKWGGLVDVAGINSNDKASIEIQYKSISLPLTLEFKALEKKNVKWLLLAGAGADVTFTYSIMDNQSNKNEPSYEEDIRNYTPFLLLGSSLEFKPSKNRHLKYVIGFTINDDHLFNTQRTVLIDTKFWRDEIPLHSTIFSTFIGIKL